MTGKQTIPFTACGTVVISELESLITYQETFQELNHSVDFAASDCLYGSKYTCTCQIKVVLTRGSLDRQIADS
jgi:hypothetical protein